MTKTCKMCNLSMSLNLFKKDNRLKSGFSNFCKKCHNIKHKQWQKINMDHITDYRKKYQATNKDKIREYKKKWNERNKDYSKNDNLKRLYGITFEEYKLMCEEQRHLCKICLLKTELVVDHDHNTGKVRGLLCINCNLTLGNIKDNIFNLYNAIQYLKSYNDVTSGSEGQTK